VWIHGDCIAPDRTRVCTIRNRRDDGKHSFGQFLGLFGLDSNGRSCKPTNDCSGTSVRFPAAEFAQTYPPDVVVTPSKDDAVMVAISAFPTAVASPHAPSVSVVRSASRSTAALWQIALAVMGVALVIALVLMGPVPGVGSPAAAASASSVVATSADTMWSLAVEHAPAGEAAIYVERLIERNGTAVILSGQLVVLPAP
jgi:hypothetical protein